MTINITVAGDDDVIKHFDPAMLGAPFRKMLTKSGITVVNHAKPRTPVRTGRLRASETSDVDPRPIPIWAKAGSNVVYAPFVENRFGMFARALDDSAGAISAFAEQAEEEIAAALGGST